MRNPFIFIRLKNKDPHKRGSLLYHHFFIGKNVRSIRDKSSYNFLCMCIHNPYMRFYNLLHNWFCIRYYNRYNSH